MCSPAFARTSDTLYESAINALAAYFLHNVGKGRVPDINQISLAFDHIYRPAPGFWRNFSTDMAVAALDISCPDFRDEDQRLRSAHSSGLANSFEINVAIALIDRILHESLAEELLAVPPLQRPSGNVAVFKWMCSVLSKSRQKSMLKAIRQSGLSSAAKVLKVARAREDALDS